MLNCSLFVFSLNTTDTLHNRCPFNVHQRDLGQSFAFLFHIACHKQLNLLRTTFIFLAYPNEVRAHTHTQTQNEIQYCTVDILKNHNQPQAFNYKMNGRRIFVFNSCLPEEMESALTPTPTLAHKHLLIYVHNTRPVLLIHFSHWIFQLF